MARHTAVLCCAALLVGVSGQCPSSAQWPSQLSSSMPAVDNTGFARCHGKLRLDGVQLVGSSGEAVQLMGVSSHGLHWFPQCNTRESLANLVQTWGINVFRASMYVGEGGYATDPSIKQQVLDIVQWTQELGIYVIIDWHMLTPGDPNDATYSGAVSFWRDIARRYRDSPHVLYEIANEPNLVSWDAVLRYHNRIIDVIRAEDPQTVVLAGTPTWSQDIHLAAARPVARPHNVMYVFHFYAGDHMGLLSRVVQQASRIPVFVSEWGASGASGDDGLFLRDGFRFVDTFRSVGSAGVKLSWTAWSIADKAETSASFQPGACRSRAWESVSCHGAFIRAYIRTNVATCAAPPSPTSTTTPTPPTPPTPSTPSPPVRTPQPAPPAQCSPVSSWGNCVHNPCCHTGWTCYEMSQWYAQCRPDGNCRSSSSWTCRVLGAAGPPPARTCARVWDAQACRDDQGGCYTCGQRIDYMKSTGLSDTAARNSIATSFPQECGPCGQ